MKTTKPQRYLLAEVRRSRETTQVQLAKKAKMRQSDVSEIEHRTDARLSTLTRYARALGGSIETAIVVDGERYVLDLPR